MIDVSELMNDPDFIQPVLLKTQTVSTVDFQAVQIVTATTIFASVQPAEKEKLNADAIDWSRAYKMVHSLQPMGFGQFIEYKGRDYKIIQINDYDDNGYFEVIAEETKLPLLVPEFPANYVTHNGQIVTYMGQPVTYVEAIPSNAVTYLGELVTFNGEIVTYSDDLNYVTYLGEPVTFNGEIVTFSEIPDVLTYLGDTVTHLGEPVTL